MDTGIEALLADIVEVSEPSQIPVLLKELTDYFGLRTAAYLGTGSLDRTVPRREPFIAVTYSSEWIERYRSCGYLKIDPAIQIGLRRILPIDWGDLGGDDSSLRHFFGEASEFGLGRRGMSFPVHGNGRNRALFSVTADTSDREWQWMHKTTFRYMPVIAAHLHDAILRTEGVPRKPARLSPRELECLRWSAKGKTSWECAVILGLSPHTVKCYLESARHKLGASSNTHAVAIASEADLLFELP